jgi:hypothetical protein
VTGAPWQPALDTGARGEDGEGAPTGTPRRVDEGDTRADMFEQQETHLYLNPVAVDRAQDFERFLLDVVEPAIRTQRPDLMGRWRILRPTRPETSDDGVLTYAFLFDGGDMDQDWELAKLLPRQYGEGEAQRLISDWLAMFVPYKRWLTSIGEPEGDIVQPGWTFTALDGSH